MPPKVMGGSDHPILSHTRNILTCTGHTNDDIDVNGQFGIHFHVGLESEPERGHVVADLRVEKEYHGAERQDANWNNIHLTCQPTLHLE